MNSDMAFGWFIAFLGGLLIIILVLLLVRKVVLPLMRRILAKR